MTRKSRIHWRRIKVQELCRKDILIEIAQILQVSKGIVAKVQMHKEEKRSLSYRKNHVPKIHNKLRKGNQRLKYSEQDLSNIISCKGNKIIAALLTNTFVYLTVHLFSFSI